MGAEVSEAFKAGYDLLAADATLRGIVGEAQPKIYAEQAPQGVEGIYILVDLFSSTDSNGLGTARVQTELLMLWRVVMKGQPNADFRTAVNRVDVIFQNTVRYVSGGYVFSIRRERPFRRATYDAANNRYSEEGGFYRNYVSAA